MVLLSFSTAAPGIAQDSEQSSIPTPAPTPPPTPIPASDIPARAAADADTARQAVANAAPGARPEPTCFFVGFGDSSLDFQLRAWTAESAFMRTSSNLRFAMVRKLGEAGIEIPFPQRDLHLRTPDPEAESWAELQNRTEEPPQDGADGLVTNGTEETEKTDD